MVFSFFSFAAIIATISLSVSLRDVDDELSDSTSETKLWGLITRSIEKAHANEEHRVELLQEAVSYLESIQSKGSNASQYMDSSQKAQFRQVLNLIEDSIFDSINQSHDSTVESLENSILPISQCDEVRLARLSQSDDFVGDVYYDEKHMNSFREDHAECRVTEQTHYTNNDTAWANFHRFFKNIVTMRDWRFPAPRSLDSLNDYFMFKGPMWIKRYHEEQELYKSWRAAYVEADNTLRAHMDVCSSALTKLEMQFCAYQVQLRGLCRGYKSCRDRSIANYYVINTTSHRSAAARKKIWRSGVYIVEHIKCLIGDGCRDPATDDSHYDVAAPPYNAAAVCDTGPVNYEPCTDSFERQFIGSFVTLTDRQSLSVRDNCTQCIVLPPVNRSKDSCTDNDGNYTNHFDSNCLFYDDHMGACGKNQYDGNGGFDSSSMCCSCGGGFPPL